MNPLWTRHNAGPVFRGNRARNDKDFGGTVAMAKTLSRHIRIGEDHWRRIEALAEARNMSPNQLLVEFAVEALDRREWPRTELEIQLLRSAMFAAQALARNMIANGRSKEVEQIRRGISETVPELPTTDPANRNRTSLDRVDRASPETRDE